MNTYAQLHEDTRLWNALGTGSSRVYVDIGAGHPDEQNVTKLFYENGWRGINVEPGLNFEALKAARPLDVNINAAVSKMTGTAAYYHSPIHGDLSSLEPIPGANISIALTVPLVRVLDRYVQGREIGFLKVDVEGHERTVLESNDWTRFRPLVLCIEAIDAYSHERNSDLWDDILDEVGYLFAYFDGVNEFWVREDRKDLIAPLNIGLPELPGYPREGR